MKKLKGQSKVVDCFGFPLPAPNPRINLKSLVAHIRTMLGQLESRAISNDAEAMREFEWLLSAYGAKHQHLLRERAKAGDRSFHSSSSIQELLWLADDTIECLGWLAKRKTADCERHAVKRLNWPGFISVLPSIEAKSQALKACIPLGRNFEHYDNRRTQADSLFRVARFVIDYVSKPSGDSFSGIYYAPFIEGVLWMKSQERGEAIKKFNLQQGLLKRERWLKWKPVLTRIITLYYGPSSERWKMIPNSPIPPTVLHTMGKSRLRLKTYRDICPAEHFGVLKEWGDYLSKNHQLTTAEKTEIQMWANRQNKSRPCLIDIEPDDALKNIHARVERRDGGWGDFKSEILRRCYRLLPKT